MQLTDIGAMARDSRKRDWNPDMPPASMSRRVSTRTRMS
jgi:hypothetical protein